MLEVDIQFSVERLSRFPALAKSEKHFGKRKKIDKGGTGGEVEKEQLDLIH